MIVRTTTTVMFHVPDEYKQHERFKADNNMSKWQEHHSSNFWCYSTTQEVMTTQEGEKHDG